jgi:hypothetical protein
MPTLILEDHLMPIRAHQPGYWGKAWQSEEDQSVHTALEISAVVTNGASHVRSYWRHQVAFLSLQTSRLVSLVRIQLHQEWQKLWTARSMERSLS